MANAAPLPYVTAPGNITKALNAIAAAATPEKVSQDFVKSVLGIGGGSGNQITTYLRRIGFANSAGDPTDLYSRFRNAATRGAAVAAAVKLAYAPLYARNEYMHTLDPTTLSGLVTQETGAAVDSKGTGLIVSCINNLKAFADFDAPDAIPGEVSNPPAPLFEEVVPPKPPVNQTGVGMNLSYTINLNLPATTDIAVFNAIFKALKENLLRDLDG